MPRLDPFDKPPRRLAYSFAWVTGGIFAASWLGQLVFQAMAMADEAAAHGEVFSWPRFWPQFLASTFENWQSEAAQLIWQAAGLAIFYHWGSSQSREGADRVEAKIDQLRGLVDDLVRRSG